MVKKIFQKPNNRKKFFKIRTFLKARIISSKCNIFEELRIKFLQNSQLKSK